MNRQLIFYRTDEDAATFEKDELAPALPLPKLDDTLARYYESLKPFGTEAELLNSKKIIEKFKNGIGPKLQAILEERASIHKNWVNTILYCSDINVINK